MSNRPPRMATLRRARDRIAILAKSGPLHTAAARAQGCFQLIKEGARGLQSRRRDALANLADLEQQRAGRRRIEDGDSTTKSARPKQRQRASVGSPFRAGVPSARNALDRWFDARDVKRDSRDSRSFHAPRSVAGDEHEGEGQDEHSQEKPKRQGHGRGGVECGPHSSGLCAAVSPLLSHEAAPVTAWRGR
jgi:hypothetical protein